MSPSRTQHATATTVRIRFEDETQATALAYSEVSHDFTHRSNALGLELLKGKRLG